MKKVLLSFVMLMTAVLSASAFTVYVGDDFTGKEDDTFVIYKYFSTGITDQLLYTVTYEINTPATGTTASTAALVSIKDIVFEGNNKSKLKDFEFPAFFAIEKRDGTKMGYGRVNTIGSTHYGELFKDNEVVETVTLNFYEGGKHYIEVAQYAFNNCTHLKHIYVTTEAGVPSRPTFECIGKYAFTNTPAFTDTVSVVTKVERGLGLGFAFNNSGITAAELYYGSNSTIGVVFQNCPNLTSISLGGGTKNGSTIVRDCPKLKKVVWTGSNNYDLDKASQSPFYDVREQITSLTIEGSVPAHMFEGFTNILSVQSSADLGTKNVRIGARAFAGCTNLITAAVGGKMDQSAFEDCPKLTSITWRGGFSWDAETPSASKSPLHSVGVQLKRITFRGTNTSIPDYLCADMRQLESVQIIALPNGAIGAHAFEGCKKLETVDFSDEDGRMITGGNSYWIWENAFAGCTSLHEIINLPESRLWRIDDRAFYNCSALKDCPISQKFTALRHIGTEAFAKSGISALVVPAGVTSTGGLLVNDCPNIDEVYFLPNTTTANDFGGSWANLLAAPDNAARGRIRNIYLNYKLNMIPEEMFLGYSGLVNQLAVIPSVVSPRNLALMPDVQIIYSSAFKDCAKLELCAALFSPALTQIFPSAFENSNIKTSLAEMANLTTIWNDAFKNCPNIKRFGAEKIEDAENVLPKLQTISANAFDGCKNLTSVHLPANLKTISPDAFANCPVETVLYGVTSYGYADPLGNAGIDKTKVKVYEIGDNVTLIPSYFAQGAQLTTVAIGYNVQSIGQEAFADCEQLKYVSINTDLSGMSTQYNAMNPGIAPFVRSGVNTVSFGPAAKAAGRCIMAGATHLKLVNIKNVVDFGEYSFSGTGLEVFTFNNTNAIKSNAFSNNTELKTLNIAGTAPASVSSAAFDGCSVEQINASCSNYGAVSASSTWKAVCANIKNADSFDYPDMSDTFYKGQGKQNVTSVMDCDGKFTVDAEGADGFAFISWNDGNTENPRTVDMNEFNLSSLYPIFDNPSLYTEEIKLTVTPANAGSVKVYNEETNEEITGGKYKRNGHFVFVPQPADVTNWYEFGRWEYDVNKTATQYAADDALYPHGLGVDLLFMPGGENEGEIPEFPEEITAVFLPKDIQVEVRSCTDGHGTIKIEGEQKLGGEITLTAVPDNGYEFAHWGSDDQATEASVKVVLSLDNILKADANPENPGTPVLENGKLLPYEESALYFVELCANFKEAQEQKVTITAAGEHCTIEGAGEYKAGEEVTLIVFAEPYYNFEKWSDGETANPRVFTATEDLTVTAICVADSFTVTVTYNPEVVEIEGRLRYAYGEETELTAKLKDPSHYTFDGWFWDKSFEDALSLKLEVTKNINVDVRVTANLYAITTEAKPAEGGTVLGAGNWPFASPFVLIAEANEGYEFIGWEDDMTAPAKRELTVAGEAHYTALFHLIGEGIEEVESQDSTVGSRKVLREGVLYIERNGKTYSVQGQSVK